MISLNFFLVSLPQNRQYQPPYSLSHYEPRTRIHQNYYGPISSICDTCQILKPYLSSESKLYLNLLLATKYTDVDQLYLILLESPRISRDNQSDMILLKLDVLFLFRLRDVITATAELRLTGRSVKNCYLYQVQGAYNTQQVLS